METWKFLFYHVLFFWKWVWVLWSYFQWKRYGGMQQNHHWNWFISPCYIRYLGQFGSLPKINQTETIRVYPRAALATARGSSAHELPFRSLTERRDLSRASCRGFREIGPFLWRCLPQVRWYLSYRSWSNITYPQGNLGPVSYRIYFAMLCFLGGSHTSQEKCSLF